MNRGEIIKLLSILSEAYPASKIKDAASMATTWEMCLGEFSADSVYKAARLHINTSKFFPTVAEIRDKIVRAGIVYNEDSIEVKRIGGDQVKMLEGTTQTQIYIDDYVEGICRDVGFGYPNEFEK